MKNNKYLLQLNSIIDAALGLIKPIFKPLNRKPLSLEYITKNVATNGRSIEFYFENHMDLTGHDISRAIYNSLWNRDDFQGLGFRKVIITTGRDYDNTIFNIHPNIFCYNTTTSEEYSNKVNLYIENRYDSSGYLADTTKYFVVQVWNMDSHLNKKIKITNKIGQFRSYSTSAYLNNSGTTNLITTPPVRQSAFEKLRDWLKKIREENPLAKDFITHFSRSYKDTAKDRFSTLDLETIKLPLHKDIQIPVCITHKTSKDSNAHYYQVNTENLNCTDLSLIQADVTEMFREFMSKITVRSEGRFNNRFIFVHNLGGFDGIFIHKALVEIYGDKITCLIDDSNKYISITYNGQVIDTNDPKNFNVIQHWTQLEHKQNEYKIEFKDSCRLFPVSLDQLCQVFGVKGKSGKYNLEFNTSDLFNKPELLKEFIFYAKQDVISLHAALTSARSLYATDWDVDIIHCYSAANLSLRVFRHKFMTEMLNYICVLRNSHDKLIRKSYFGGATDLYKQVGEALHYYDVNSLYPFAMLQKIPVAVKEIITITADFDKDWYKTFFGFIEVEVTCPAWIKIPLLPMKYQGKTIFPRGTWIGTYFSEELYAVMKHGYIIKPLIGGQAASMRGEYIFREYVKAFYAIKATSKGAQRWIAKMHLNSLYGIFGRSMEINSTILVPTSKVEANFGTKLMDRIISITSEYSLIRYKNNISLDLIKGLQTEYRDLQHDLSKVSNNVAVASAVTAYGRIHMIQFKVGEMANHICYTDTDSIFTSKELPESMMGTELGLMKDELDGQVISKAYFLGIKRYFLVLPEGKTKSVWAV